MNLRETLRLETLKNSSSDFENGFKISSVKSQVELAAKKGIPFVVVTCDSTEQAYVVGYHFKCAGLDFKYEADLGKHLLTLSWY